MAYQFLVQNFYIRKADGAATGALIVVRCDRKDDGTGEVTGSTTTSWEAATTDFAAWPPTTQQARDYIVSYLQETPPGWGQTRVDAMKAGTAVIVHDEEIWPPAERVLPLS